MSHGYAARWLQNYTFFFLLFVLEKGIVGCPCRLKYVPRCAVEK
jgi:hypothetical protein